MRSREICPWLKPWRRLWRERPLHPNQAAGAGNHRLTIGTLNLSAGQVATITFTAQVGARGQTLRGVNWRVTDRLSTPRKVFVLQAEFGGQVGAVVGG